MVVWCGAILHDLGAKAVPLEPKCLVWFNWPPKLSMTPCTSQI